MNEIKWVNTLGSLALCASSLFAFSNAGAATTDPVDQLYNFQATGTFNGPATATNGRPTYDISATGRAPRVKENGLIVVDTPEKEKGNNKGKDDDAYTVELTGAKISFDPFDFNQQPFPAIVNFTCDGCMLKYPDGSTLTSDPSVPLQGRAIFAYGPVAFDPTTPNILTIRMAGCSGLHEVAGVGKLAGKVGTICFNGVFHFDATNPYALTGESNCTIVTHTPPSAP